MKIVSPSKISTIVSCLKQGDVIAYPTETSYGLGCLLSKTQSVKRIFAIKERPPHQSFIVLVRDIAMAKQYVDWNANADKIAQQFWPGSVTLILQAKKTKGTLAVRVSPHPFLKKVFSQLSEPLISTSLNKHRKSNCYSLSGFRKQFKKTEIDLFVNAGTLSRKKPSMIVDVTHQPTIIRPSTHIFTKQVDTFLQTI